MTDEQEEEAYILLFTIKKEGAKAMIERSKKALEQMKNELWKYRHSSGYSEEKATKSQKRIEILENTLWELSDILKATDYVLMARDSLIFTLRKEAQTWHQEYIKSCESEIEMTKIMLKQIKSEPKHYSHSEIINFLQQNK
jgi:signal recognition particle GTPase